MLLLYRHSFGSTKINHLARRLIGSFILGVFLITLLIVATLVYMFGNLFYGSPDTLPEALLVSEIVVGTATALIIWFFYYRSGAGTMLWIPRSWARFLTKRATKTKTPAEAFSLGMTSLIGELPFILVLMVTASSAIIALPLEWQFLAIATYTALSIAPLIIANLVSRTEYSISHIQRWREHNKTFLKIIAGCGLITLSAYLVVFKLLAHLGQGV
jgi:hypothetical protein